MLILHITVALASLISAGIALISPTAGKLKVSYALVAGTLLTGTLLVLLQPVNLPRVCISGLVYLALAGLTLTWAQRRFAAGQNQL